MVFSSSFLDQYTTPTGQIYHSGNHSEKGRAQLLSTRHQIDLVSRRISRRVSKQNREVVEDECAHYFTGSRSFLARTRGRKQTTREKTEREPGESHHRQIQGEDGETEGDLLSPHFPPRFFIHAGGPGLVPLCAMQIWLGAPFCLGQRREGKGF